MRRSVTRTLLQGQDVCLFCALRYGIGTSTKSNPRLEQLRTYKSSASNYRPAGAAAARIVEEDDEEQYSTRNNTFSQLLAQSSSQRPPPNRFRERSSLNSRSDWKCQCGNINSPIEINCAKCASPRSTTVKQPAKNQNFSDPFSDRLFKTGLENPFGQNDRSSRHGDERREFRPRELASRPISRYGPGQHLSKGRPSTDAFNARREQNLQIDNSSSDFQPFADRVRRIAGRQSETQRRSPVKRFGIFADHQSDSAETFLPRRTVLPWETAPISDKARVVTTEPISPTSPILNQPEDTELGVLENGENIAHDLRRHKALESRTDRRSQRYEIDVDETASGSGPVTTYSNKNPRQERYNRSRGPDFDADAAESSFYDNEARKRKQKSKRPKRLLPVEHVAPRLQIPEFMSVEKLAKSLKVKVEDFVAKLEEEGFEGARNDHILDAGTSAMFAELYGFEPVTGSPEQHRDLFARPPPVDASILPQRPPIVTIMGHVDHGKTTILDWLRKSSVVESEHGGITQHIGAFSVVMPGTKRQITFLDTPGHAAFLDMRRRGATVTDIVVLVVAADDSVKPQTIEAIKHALEAKVHIIVAINKIDKEEANIERVKQDLLRHDITVEDFDGEYQAIPVSGKTGRGMQDLEEAILTLADVSDFRAETEGLAEGWIIESKVTTAGRVATVLVRRGTLRPGDSIVAGTTWARIRTLRNDAGQLVSEAPPGTPVQVDGWRGDDPTAGLEVLQAENEEHAKTVVDIRQEKAESLRTGSDTTAINASRAEEAEARAKVLAWEAEQGVSRRRRHRSHDNEGWVEKPASAGPKQIHFVIKADVAGSVEALVAAVKAIGNNEITANIVHSGTGILTESDIRHLATTGEVGYAISFNQPVEKQIQRLAEAAELPILDHNIIYKVTDEVKDKLSAELPPLVTQKVLGEADVGLIFNITVKKKKIKIAGCKVTNGTISRSEKIRVLRRGEVVYTGMLDSLKNVKKDVTEMRKGTECGVGFENWEDFQPGDQIQSFEEIVQKRTLYS